jgi:hypothetical protein
MLLVVNKDKPAEFEKIDSGNFGSLNIWERSHIFSCLIYAQIIRCQINFFVILLLVYVDSMSETVGQDLGFRHQKWAESLHSL